MPWNGSDGAGFSAGMPWLPLLDDLPLRSVAARKDDPRSTLRLYRRLLALRRDWAKLYTAPRAGTGAR